MHFVKKIYRDLPAAHRQPNHEGHCRLIHGHNWEFHITFACAELDKCGFVVDIGSLGVVKDFLNDEFDHTLLLNHSDPMLSEESSIQSHDFLAAFAKLVTVPNCGMEGLAEYVCTKTNNKISFGHLDGKERGLHVCEVVCWEDSKNSSTYEPDHLRNWKKV